MSKSNLSAGSSWQELPICWSAVEILASFFTDMKWRVQQKSLFSFLFLYVCVRWKQKMVSFRQPPPKKHSSFSLGNVNCATSRAGNNAAVRCGESVSILWNTPHKHIMGREVDYAAGGLWEASMYILMRFDSGVFAEILGQHWCESKLTAAADEQPNCETLEPPFKPAGILFSVLKDTFSRDMFLWKGLMQKMPAISQWVP